jgi:hypothetical protein
LSALVTPSARVLTSADAIVINDTQEGFSSQKMLPVHPQPWPRRQCPSPAAAAACIQCLAAGSRHRDAEASTHGPRKQRSRGWRSHLGPRHARAGHTSPQPPTTTCTAEAQVKAARLAGFAEKHCLPSPFDRRTGLARVAPVVATWRVPPRCPGPDRAHQRRGRRPRPWPWLRRIWVGLSGQPSGEGGHAGGGLVRVEAAGPLSITVHSL